jgi:hypothetical protein
MMEQRRVQSFTSSPYQYVVDYPGPQDLSRCGSHDPVPLKNIHGSFDERTSFHHYASEPSTTRSLSAPIDAFDSWALEGPPCGSPLSTSSSISHPESVPTPPYTGLPMYDTAESPAFQHIRSPASHEAWSGEPEPLWRPSYPEVPAWGSQQYSLPYHGGPACEQMSLQPVQDYMPRSGPLATPAYFSYHTPVHYPAARVVASTRPKRELASNPELSDQESDSELEESESDDETSSHKSSFPMARRSGANANVMKLGKWGITTVINTASDNRPYHCPLQAKEHSDSPCTSRFQRPEHLRRHVRTVHTDERCHFCKVCPRTFSRGDNLHDHYWTHVERGGRAGSNRKMGIPELKTILGPKGRPIIKRLRLKLARHQAKHVRAKL